MLFDTLFYNRHEVPQNYSLFNIHHSLLIKYAGVAELVALSPHAACGGYSKGEMAQRSKSLATSRSDQRFWVPQEGLQATSSLSFCARKITTPYGCGYFSYCTKKLELERRRRGQGTRPPPVAEEGSVSWRSGQNSEREANKEFWVPQEGCCANSSLSVHFRNLSIK